VNSHLFDAAHDQFAYGKPLLILIPDMLYLKASSPQDMVISGYCGRF
jgi:hypothetical protein